MTAKETTLLGFRSIEARVSGLVERIGKELTVLQAIEPVLVEVVEQTQEKNVGSQQPVIAKPNRLVKNALIIGGILFVLYVIASSMETQKARTSSGSSYSPPSYSPPQPAASQPTREMYEDRPPVGTGNVLSTAQLRYCVFENERLESMTQLVNQYIETQVTQYNAAINDYNNRCSSFRYRRGALESVRAEVSNQKMRLNREAKERVATW